MERPPIDREEASKLFNSAAAQLHAQGMSRVSPGIVPEIQLALEQLRESAVYLQNHPSALLEAINSVHDLRERVEIENHKNEAAVADRMGQATIVAPSKRGPARRRHKKKKPPVKQEKQADKQEEWHEGLMASLDKTTNILIAALGGEGAPVQGASIEERRRVPMAFISDLDCRDANGSQLGSFLQCVKDGLIVVATRSLISGVNIEDDEKFRERRQEVEATLIKDMEGRSLFSYGEYVVAIPSSLFEIPGVDRSEIIERLGFDSERLRAITPHEVLSGRGGPSKFEDFMRLFGKRPVARFVIATGHGGKDGMVAAMKRAHYREFLHWLKESEAGFLLARSCYAGGRNRGLALRFDGKRQEPCHRPFLPFPVAVQSADEVTSHLPHGWRPAPFLDNTMTFAMSLGRRRDFEEVLDQGGEVRNWGDPQNCIQFCFRHPADAIGGFRSLRRAANEVSLTYHSETERLLAPKNVNGRAIKESEKEKEEKVKGDSGTSPHQGPIRIAGIDTLKVQCLEVHSHLEFEGSHPSLLSLVPGTTHHFFRSITLPLSQLTAFLDQLSSVYKGKDILKVLMINSIRCSEGGNRLQGFIINLSGKTKPGRICFVENSDRKIFYLNGSGQKGRETISRDRYLSEAFSLLLASEPTAGSVRNGGPWGGNTSLWEVKFRSLCTECREGEEDSGVDGLRGLPELVRTQAASAERRVALGALIKEEAALKEEVEALRKQEKDQGRSEKAGHKISPAQLKEREAEALALAIKLEEGIKRCAALRSVIERQRGRSAELEAKQAMLEEALFKGVADRSALIHLALRLDLPTLAKRVLEDKSCNLDLNSVDLLGNTPLIYAVTKGRSQLVELLIERGADPSLASPQGYTPLMYAAKNRNKMMV